MIKDIIIKLTDPRIRKYIIASIIVPAITAFILWGPPDMLRKTSEPEYCNTCHVMNEQFEAWFMTGLHRNIKCVDCHLPNSGHVRHFIWKGLDGMKDLAMFHSGIYSEDIGISSHGKKIVKENCLRCHESMSTAVNTDERDCWSCHRRVMHRQPSIGMLH